MTLATIVALVAEEAEHQGNVQQETMIFGVIALAVFLLLGFITFSYRNVANRHSGKAAAYAAEHANDVVQAGHGHH
ncbi:hypothetical protein [Microbacterium sp.]|uniref:hypothetical protein n=1 Tax=Microbacterium sp. TaxID=51671 RepID=UPI0032217145